MATVITSPADVVNLALTRIGRKDTIGNLYDGSEAASTALTIYSQTRDELLRENDWDFSRRDVGMALLKSAPVGGYFPPNLWDPATNPPLPWLFEYEYPDDCIKIRAIKAQPLFIPVFDPQPVVFSVANDNSYSPAKKVILCNVDSPVLVYTGQVTNPVQWEPLFVEALAAALGRRLAPALANLDTAKMEGADEQLETSTAAMKQG